MIIDPKSVVLQQPKWLAPAARRRMTGISLAVVLAMPMISPGQTPQPDTQVVLVSLQNTDANAALTSAIQKLNSGKYEEALTDLQSIKADSLSESDRMLLTDSIAKAEQASQMRRGARADFDKAESALAEGRYVEAANLYKSVASNEYADEGTRAKAREQLAVAEASQKSTETDLKAVYASAVADYKAGNYDSAKTKFTQLQEAGYKPAWFDKSPRQYLEAIEKEQAGPSPAEQARSAYLTGRDQYRKGDWIAARQNFNKAIELNYKPGWFEESPEKYLAIMDKKEKADAEKAAREAMLASAVTPEAPAPAPVQPAESPKVSASPETSAGPTGSESAAAPATPVTPAPAASTTDSDAEKLRQLAAAQEIELTNKAAQARKLVADAQAAEQAQNLSTAADLYSKALELDPTNPDAQAGRNRTLAAAGLSPVQTDLATRQEQRILAERQAIVFNVDLALSKADAQIARGQFNEARQSITQAEVASRQNPGIFTNEELQNFQTRIATARTQLEQAVIASEQAARAAAQRTAEEEARQRQIEQERARQQAVSSLIADSRRLTEQGKYDEALKTVNQILSIDPNNDYAKGVRPILFDRASLNKQKVLRQKYTEQWIQTFDNLDEAKIPYSDILTYPADWPDLSARREQTVREERAITAADEAVAGLLEKSLPEIRFQDVAFADVIDFLRDTTQANIFVNWKALEAAGIDRNAPVSTRLRNVKFSKVLKTILDSVGGGATSQVSYTVDEGVITISTTEDLARNVETRTYDIRDLIIAIPDFTNAPDFSLTDNGNNTGTGTGGTGGFGGGGGSGRGLFGNNSNNNNDEDEETPTRAELVEQITNLIRTTIGVGTWQEDGGQLGTLSELGGQLIVTQTPEVHRQISSLLEKLREQRSIQVMIEARFLTVQRNFLEDIGVDFDFFINNDGNPFEGLVPGTGPLPIGINGQQQTGFAPIAVQQNSANFTQAGSLQTGINGNLAGQFSSPNLSTTINAFLDDFQASLLIRATQGNQNVTQLTAPRVTLFNGQRAYVLVARQISYVSDLTPIVGTNAFGFDPTIDVIQSGVVLDVAATVSADRKYVTLTLRPQLSRIIGIQSFPVFGGNNGDDGTGGGGTPTTGVGFIQQPEIEITEVRTSVSVPDGGTLLLGGTTLSGEVEREAGVPVLSKIPFLKRAFTNRGYARDESVLLIMVKPTIIIQREVEQENFPLLTSRAN